MFFFTAILITYIKGGTPAQIFLKKASAMRRRLHLLIFFTVVIKFYWLMLLYPGELYRLLGASSYSLSPSRLIFNFQSLSPSCLIFNFRSMRPSHLIFNFQSLRTFNIDTVYFLSFVHWTDVLYFSYLSCRLQRINIYQRKT